jgi:hypothetical protein
VAFVQHADALVADLGGDRGAFWGAQLAVVDALLADASDKVAHHVQVKVAAAHANFERLYGAEPSEFVEFVRKLRYSEDSKAHWEPAVCPACSSTGMASGEYDVDWDSERHEYDPDYNGAVSIDANWFFGTTEDQVSAMIAADWYGVHPDAEISARALRLSPALDSLSEADAELVETLARRLAGESASVGS